MFVRYFIELPLTLTTAEEALLREPQEWVPGLAHEAQGTGDRLLADVGFGEKRRVSRRFFVDVGEPMRFPSRTVVPITWQAADSAALFPTLDADLEIAELGPEMSQLSISARYKPPAGWVGRVADRALLHRVAEATIKDFLERAGGRIASLVPSANPV
ncbi:MAG: hypothetical protein WD276_04455 [Actinomycetota bacterium]